MLEQVRPRDLTQWFANATAKGAPVVLDVREPHELQLASIKPQGFALLSIPMGVVPLRLTELDPEQPIACLCHHGGRSMQVTQFLLSRGFEHVANIAGGINAWSAELDPAIPRY
ncbi:rhodanese-like domain-containing protein [Candidatus Aalborgicola defluviihabitans]|uniref:rhodanese-like domain-containing protein n=1 Tax=Candidatus Aalborgicola defluviihabitans TaxID=3386187 RepID=UPI001DBCBDE9|nr:sulfurtransferase [Burkholderiales bacterium]